LITNEAILPENQTLFDFDFEILNKKPLSSCLSSALLEQTKVVNIESQESPKNKDANEPLNLSSVDARLFSASTNHLYSSITEGDANRSRFRPKNFSIKKQVKPVIRGFKLEKDFKIGDFSTNASTNSRKSLKKILSFSKINKRIKISSDRSVDFGSHSK